MYLVSIWDQKAECFLNPIAVRALGEGQRIFQDAINNKNADNPLSVHPEDFALFEVGAFDSLTGEVIRVDSPAPRLLVRGEIFVTK